MTRKLLAITGIGLAAVLAAGVGGLRYSWNQRVARAALIDRKHFFRIERGMSRAEVEAILDGPPGDLTTRETRFFWVIHDASGFQDRNWGLWAADQGLIEIAFDQKDRADLVHFADGEPVPQPPLAERVKDWFLGLWR
jgi:hypothetical protein